MPLLKKYDIPAVLFVVTSLINTDTPFWWDEILYYTHDHHKVRWAKTISNRERLEYIETLRANRVKPPCQQQQLTIDELRVLERNGIAIANHTMSHPMLDKLSDHELESELTGSADFLKENGFQYSNVLAYPNGNISDGVIKKLKQAGYQAGFLFNHRLTSSNDSPYKISRLSVNDYTPLWKYKMILSGLHSTLLNVKRKALG
jgi:peptidoglycan/xylan/chitin deacetylase (PgdA/CDA1 family)